MATQDRDRDVIAQLTYQQRSRLDDLTRALGVDDAEFSNEIAQVMGRFVLGEISLEQCRSQVGVLIARSA